MGAMNDTFAVSNIVLKPYTVTPESTVNVINNMTGDYEVTYNVSGLAAKISSNVEFRFYAWYVDENNYVEICVEWSSGDRPHEIRAIHTKGNINGSFIGWNEDWGDNPNNNTLPVDGFQLTVKKSGNVFTHTLTCPNGVVKTKSVTVNIDTTAQYSVFMGAMNDTFKVEQILKAEYEVEEDTSFKVTPESTYELAASKTGDYEITIDVEGLATKISSNVEFRFYAWYVDENNYVEVCVEWSSGDRPHEIRAIHTKGYINGEFIGWNEDWGDNPSNNTLPVDGFKLTVKKTGNSFSHTLVCSNGVTKSKTVTVNIDTTAEYTIKLGAMNDTFTCDNLLGL